MDATKTETPATFDQAFERDFQDLISRFTVPHAERDIASLRVVCREMWMLGRQRTLEELIEEELIAQAG